MMMVTLFFGLPMLFQQKKGEMKTEILIMNKTLSIKMSIDCEIKQIKKQRTQ